MRSFFRNRIRYVRDGKSDRGAAIVAAIGVMIICISLGVLVVSQAIVSQRDSARNRARTVEIHTAEGGVDTLHASLQRGIFPQFWSSDDSEGFGALGPDEVGAYAEIKYWDAEGNPMDIFDSNGFLVWDLQNMPARAQILVTSENERSTMAGIEPKRSFESEVLLEKEIKPRVGAALFSASPLHLTNSSQILGEGADVWVDEGDLECSNDAYVAGNVYVPDGGVTMSNNCKIAENAEAVRDVRLTGAGNVIAGDVHSKTGSLKIEQSGARVEGNVLVGGSFSGNEDQDVGGTVTTGHTFGDFHLPMGLPEVFYRPADWGFNEVSAADFFANNSIPPQSLNRNGHPGACHFQGAGTIRVESPNQPTILNVDECGIETKDFELVLYSDLAIFTDFFIASGSFTVKSGDGQEHNLWIIVDTERKDLEGSRMRCDYLGTMQGIHLTGQTNFNENAPVFFYSSCDTVFTLETEFYGQVYGKLVHPSNDPVFTYREIGIPGVDLMPGYTDLEGEWNVDIIYKRETGRRVEVN